MKPASTTRSGSKAATVSVRVLSQWPRLVDCSTLRTKVGTPARSARARPSMSSRSAPTATTVAPYDGSALASSRAWRLVPPPETSTTSRQSEPAGTRTGYLSDRAPLPPGGDHPGHQAAEAHRGHGGDEYLSEGGADVGHAAGAHRAAGEGDREGADQGGAEAAAEAAQGGGVVGGDAVGALGEHRADDRHEDRDGQEGDRPLGGRSDVRQAGEQREGRHRTERDHGGRDDGAGADREAG